MICAEGAVVFFSKKITLEKQAGMYSEATLVVS